MVTQRESESRLLDPQYTGCALTSIAQRMEHFKVLTDGALPVATSVQCSVTQSESKHVHSRTCHRDHAVCSSLEHHTEHTRDDVVF